MKNNFAVEHFEIERYKMMLNVSNAYIDELKILLEKERKRSARWKACAKEKDRRVDEYEDFIFSPKKRKQDDRQTD